MTALGPTRTEPAASVVPTGALPSFIEWGPVFAGAVLAAALSFVLLTFGTAIGLSATSPWPNSGLPARVIASLAIFWTMAQQIATFMAGGYVAGRMRSRWHEPAQDEVGFRDGLHGGLVWAVGIVIGAALLMATAGTVARTGAELTAKTAVAATASSTNPMDLVLDSMLRPPAAVPRAPGQPMDDPRPQISRILTSAVASGSLSEPNRTYLAQLIAQRAGIPQEEAAKRVGEAPVPLGRLPTRRAGRPFSRAWSQRSRCWSRLRQRGGPPSKEGSIETMLYRRGSRSVANSGPAPE